MDIFCSTVIADVSNTDVTSATPDQVDAEESSPLLRPQSTAESPKRTLVATNAAVADRADIRLRGSSADDAILAHSPNSIASERAEHLYAQYLHASLRLVAALRGYQFQFGKGFSFERDVGLISHDETLAYAMERAAFEGRETLRIMNRIFVRMKGRAAIVHPRQLLVSLLCDAGLLDDAFQRKVPRERKFGQSWPDQCGDRGMYLEYGDGTAATRRKHAISLLSLVLLAGVLTEGPIDPARMSSVVAGCLALALCPVPPSTRETTTDTSSTRLVLDVLRSVSVLSGFHDRHSPNISLSMDTGSAVVLRGIRCVHDAWQNLVDVSVGAIQRRPGVVDQTAFALDVIREHPLLRMEIAHYGRTSDMLLFRKRLAVFVNTLRS
jgi:hypothetical protein